MDQRNLITVVGQTDISSLSGYTDELRLVLIGKTGYGKSATGNTIIGGEPVFEEDVSASSVTKKCEVATVERFGTKVRIIDTPGLFDTTLSEEEIQRELSRCISMASPGPHFFLLVLRIGKITEEDRKAVSKLQEMFGKASQRHTLIVFTGKETLLGENKTIDDFITSGNLYLKRLTCQYPYVALNNNVSDEDQVQELIDAIKNRLATLRPSSNFYTIEDFSNVRENSSVTQQQKEVGRAKIDMYLQNFKNRNLEVAAKLETEKSRILHLNQDYEKNKIQYKRQLAENKKQEEYIDNELKDAIKRRKLEVDRLECENKEEIENMLSEVKAQQEANERYQQKMNTEINDVKVYHSDGIKKVYENNEKRLTEFAENMKEKYPGEVILPMASIGTSPVFVVSFDRNDRKFYLTRNGKSRTDCIPGYDCELKVVQIRDGFLTHLYIKDENGENCLALENWF